MVIFCLILFDSNQFSKTNRRLIQIRMLHIPLLNVIHLFVVLSSKSSSLVRRSPSASYHTQYTHCPKYITLAINSIHDVHMLYENELGGFVCRRICPRHHVSSVVVRPGLLVTCYGVGFQVILGGHAWLLMTQQHQRLCVNAKVRCSLSSAVCTSLISFAVE